MSRDAGYVKLAPVLMPASRSSTRRPTATTLDEALGQIVALGRSLPRGDGVAYFNRLYIDVTRAVELRLRDGKFEHPQFLEQLAVLLTNSYLAALADYERDPASCSRAWAPLFEARARKDVAPLQFVLAGLNAHINYDVPIATVATCEAFAISPRDRSAEHDDYLQLNEIIAEKRDEVKRWLASGLVGVIDRALGRFDDVVASFSLVRAREAAWTQSKALWQIRAQPEVAGPYIEALEHTVGFAGRGLVLPTLLGIGGWAERASWLPLEIRGVLGAPKARR